MATTLDGLISTLAEQAKVLDQNISSLYAVSIGVVGSFELADPPLAEATSPEGKLVVLANYINDIALKNISLAAITAKLSETL